MMLKFWIIVVYIKDASAMDGEYPTVMGNMIYTSKADAKKAYDGYEIPSAAVTKIELVECISNKVIANRMPVTF